MKYPAKLSCAKRYHLSAFVFCLCLFCIPVFSAANAAGRNFETWLEKVKLQAIKEGVSQKTVNDAFDRIKPLKRVIELDRKQPEKKKTFPQYRDMIVSKQRIHRGREMMQKYKAELSQVSRRYGVQPQYIVALWGIETNYGTNTGGFDVIPALATLAWEGRREKFFTKELINALKIIDAGHVSAADMKGSWAGAMGQNQFMPSSFNTYAVDFDGDGRRDIWGTEIDVFASSANYLHKNGWKYGERWGRRVSLPKGFPKNLVGRKVKRPVSYWKKLGVKSYGGGQLPDSDMAASVILPDGTGKESYLIYDNYRTIMAWNRSVYFATSVGLLADAISD